MEHLALIFGGIGVFIDLSVYLMKTQKLFKRVAILNYAVWSVQYFCLTAYSAGLTMIVALGRVYLSDKCKTDLQKWYLFAGTGLGFLGLAFIGWTGWKSLIPVVAGLITTHAITFKDNIQMRKELIGSIILWLVNDYYCHAYMAIIANTIALVFNLYTIHKLSKKSFSQYNLTEKLTIAE